MAETLNQKLLAEMTWYPYSEDPTWREVLGFKDPDFRWRWSPKPKNTIQVDGRMYRDLILIGYTMMITEEFLRAGPDVGEIIKNKLLHDPIMVVSNG